MRSGQGVFSRISQVAGCQALLLCAIGVAAADNVSPVSLLEAGHFRRAQALAEPRLRANPRDAEAAYVMSRVHLAKGNLDEALKLAEKAVELESRNAIYRYQIAAVVGTQAQRANVLRQPGLARRFKREAEAALALDPKFVEARWGLMQYYLQAPGIAGGDKKKAREQAEEIARLDAVRGWFARVQFARVEKRTGDIEGYYRKAVEADPQSYDARTALAGFYASDEQKKYELAERQAREAVSIDSSRVSAYATLAITLALQGRLTDLEALLGEAENAVPDNLNPRYQAGRILTIQGKELTLAEACFRKYLAHQPELVAPDHAAARWRLAQVLEKQGRKAEAIKELETALQLRPSFEEAKKDLKRLKS